MPAGQSASAAYHLLTAVPSSPQTSGSLGTKDNHLPGQLQPLHMYLLHHLPAMIPASPSTTTTFVHSFIHRTLRDSQVSGSVLDPEGVAGK